MNQTDQIIQLKTTLVCLRARQLEELWRIKHRTLVKFPSFSWAEAERASAEKYMTAGDNLPPVLREEIRRDAAKEFRRWHKGLLKREAQGSQKEAA